MATGFAGELGLSRTIGLLAMATLAAGTRRVAGINQPERHARQPRLVGHKGAKLVEGPTAHAGSLLPPESCTVANACQFLKGNAATGIFGEDHEVFANAVIHVFAEASFPVLRPSQGPADILRAFSPALAASRSFLKRLTPGMVPLAGALDGLAGEGLSVAGRGEVDHPQVHPQEILHLDRRAFGDLYGGIEVEAPIARDQIDLAFEPVEALRLVFPIDQRNHLAASERPEAHVIHALPAEDTVVIGDRAIWAEDGATCPVALEHFDGLGDGAHRHLRRQAKAPADLVIAARMDRRLGVHFGIEAYTRRITGCSVECRHGVAQERGLFGCRQELQLQGQFHGA